MLLQRLIEKQRELKKNDAQFAELLGIPRSTWQLTRSGRVRMGERVARAARRTFGQTAPDLAEEAERFLLSDASELAETANE